MDLSILIVNWNTSDLLTQCLASIEETVHGLEYETLVVDNASTDGSPSIVRNRFPQVLLIENSENLGFAKANNQAIRNSKGKYILLLNSDAFLMEKAALSMVRFLDQHDRAGIVGANLFYPDGKPQPCHGPLPGLASEIASLFSLDKILGSLQDRNSGRLDSDFLETGYVSGACLLARRAMLDQIGLFDEDFFFFNEEVDLCRRAHQAGWNVVQLPGAITIHVAGGSTGWTANRYLMLYREKLRYFAKHQGAAARSLLLAAIWLATLSKLLGYRVLHSFSRRCALKDELWRTVAKALAQINV